MSRERHYLYLFLSVLLAATAVRIWFIDASGLNLSPDEAHYWEWSRRPDLSYYSKGPMVAYLILISTRLGGNTELFVRLPAVLLSSGALPLLYLLSLKLFNSHRLATLSALTALFVPLYAAGSILMTIDPPFIFFWLLTAYLAFSALKGSPDSYRAWPLAGAAIGLGFLSKYTMVLILPSLLLFLIFREERRWLRSKGVYLALLIALALSSPVILWNASHGWVSLRHVMGYGGGGFYFIQFLGSQLGVISPILFLLLMWALLKSWGRSREYSYLFWLSAPTLFIFFALSLKTKVQANWAAAGYMGPLVALPALIYQQAGLGMRRLFYAALGLAFAMTVLGHSLYPGFDKRLIGWRELGERVGAVARGMGDRLFIFSDRYQIASELAFYTPGQPTVYNVNLGRRLNQYDIWGGFDKLIGWDAIYVKRGDGDIGPEVIGAFRECGREPPLIIMRKEKVVTTFSLFTCKGFKGFPSKPQKERY